MNCERTPVVFDRFIYLSPSLITRPQIAELIRLLRRSAQLLLDGKRTGVMSDRPLYVFQSPATQPKMIHTYRSDARFVRAILQERFAQTHGRRQLTDAAQMISERLIDPVRALDIPICEQPSERLDRLAHPHGEFTVLKRILISSQVPLHPRDMRLRERLPDGRLGLLDSSGRARPKPQRRDEARAEPVPAGGPLSPAERWLADLWQELLGVDAVDAQDNFFDLGGHSLLAMTLVAQVEERSGVRLGILKLANSSLRALAAELSQDAIENGMRKAPGLRDRALKLFGLRRGPAS